MKSEDIKAIIRNKKLGGENPGDLRLLMEHILETFLAEKTGDINKAVDEAIKKAAEGIGEKLSKEITSYVMSRVRQPNDGHTPSVQELLRLIRPLIPKARHGKDANEKAIVARIVQSLRKPKDGKTPSTKDILNACKPLIKAMEDDWKKRLDQGIKIIRSAANNKNNSGSTGGGGMGNWTHEKFNISSATTTVTLASRVAAGGMAHILRYQGQVLDYGTHYTISGKIITLLFTPENSTVLSIAYVRT